MSLIGYCSLNHFTEEKSLRYLQSQNFSITKSQFRRRKKRYNEIMKKHISSLAIHGPANFTIYAIKRLFDMQNDLFETSKNSKYPIEKSKGYNVVQQIIRQILDIVDSATYLKDYSEDE